MKSAESSWLVTAMSDFGMVNLIGGKEYSTLSMMLYDNLNGYRANNAAVTAMVLSLVLIIIFTLVKNFYSRKTYYVDYQ